MYDWSFTVDSLSHFFVAVELADYYCALPAFSSGFGGAFSTSPGLLGAIIQDPHRLIEKAVRLRNAALYRERLIQCMGPWTGPIYESIQNESIKAISATAHAIINREVHDAQYELLDNIGRLFIDRHLSFKHAERIYAVECQGYRACRNKGLLLHWFYRRLYEADLVSPFMKKFIETLMENNLVLDSKVNQAGQGKYLDYFLYLEITDEELSWDTEETDW
jgi:hypothetical protein